MTQRLISGTDVWTKLDKILPHKKAVRAAVAYATTDSHLQLGPGDSIVVNASLAKVRQGTTDPRLLGKWLTAGVAVSTNSDLHAKLITCGRWTVVGSANLSERANRATEAVWLSTDPELQKEAKRFLRDLFTDSEEIDAGWVQRMTPLFGLDRKNEADPTRLRKPRSILPPDFQTLILSYGEEFNRELPAYVSRAIPAAASRARFRPMAHDVGPELSSSLAPGDLLVWVDEDSESMDSPQLVTARPERAGKISNWVITLKDSQLADGLSTASLPSRISQNLKKHELVILGSRAAASAVLGLWGL